MPSSFMPWLIRPQTTSRASGYFCHYRPRFGPLFQAPLRGVFNHTNIRKQRVIAEPRGRLAKLIFPACRGKFRRCLVNRQEPLPGGDVEGSVDRRRGNDDGLPQTHPANFPVLALSIRACRVL
jgi:hypothetical protein